jgi:hypothetical protein
MFSFPEVDYEGRKSGVQVLAGSRDSLVSAGSTVPHILMGTSPTRHKMTGKPSGPRRNAMSEEKLRKHLYDSYANRAHIYHLLFSELRHELGAEKAVEVMGRAIRQRGVQNAGKYTSFAPRDLEGLREAFVGNLPDDGAMFAPEVIHCDAEKIDIKFHRCPLKQTWLDAGLSQDEVAALCRIAAQVDVGLFQAAGFGFHADTYKPGGEGCCFLHIRPRE